jgi:hypothetical protein
MPLNATQTKETMRDFASEVFVQAGRTANLTTDDIEAAVTGLVTFIETNTAAINTALPEPFKSTASVEQKRHLVGLVAAKLAGL